MPANVAPNYRKNYRKVPHSEISFRSFDQWIALKGCATAGSMRLTTAIILTLAIWFPLGAFIGSRYTPPLRPPGAFSLVGIEKHAEGEFMFVVHFDRHAKLADTAEEPTRSPIELFENDRQLGPAHSTTGDIKDLGAGRYRHTPDVIYFSSSDNSDPRTNGRVYSWTLGSQQPDFKRR